MTGAKACVFKWGERGSYIHTRDEQFRIPAFKVNVSDTTGCGDSYCGGFIAGLVFGRDLRAACELATATSGSTSTGRSTAQLDISTAATTATLLMRIQGITTDVANLEYASAGVNFIVRFNFHHNAPVAASASQTTSLSTGI